MKRIKDYLVDHKHLRIIKRKKLAVVKYDGKVLFNNFKSGKSFKKWWRKFKKENKKVDWVNFPAKRLKSKLPIYYQDKQNFKNRIKGRK